MGSNKVLLVIFVACVVYVNSTCLSCLLASQPALSAPLCGTPLAPALAPSYAPLSPALGLGNPCGFPVAPPSIGCGGFPVAAPAIGCGVCGPKAVTISPCLGLITKLKGKLCAKLCGGALNPLGLKGGLCPGALPPQLYL